MIVSGQGCIVTKGHITIPGTTVIVADIIARSVEVIGKVIGNITAEKRVDIAAGARIVGDVRGEEIRIVNGSTVTGNVSLHAFTHRDLKPDNTLRPREFRGVPIFYGWDGTRFAAHRRCDRQHGGSHSLTHYSRGTWVCVGCRARYVIGA